MIEIYSNLYIGGQDDYEKDPSFFLNWKVVHACKDPYHRRALGYTGRGAPQDSPHYYFLYDNNNHLFLNIVDANSPDFFNDGMIDEMAKYCVDGLKANKKVFIHCNQGESRAPSLGLLVLRKIGYYTGSFEDALNDFIKKYPRYQPKQGILTYVRRRWYEDND